MYKGLKSTLIRWKCNKFHLMLLLHCSGSSKDLFVPVLYLIYYKNVTFCIKYKRGIVLKRRAYKEPSTSWLNN